MPVILSLQKECFMRPSGRRVEELRPITFERGFTKHAEGSVLVSFGDTKVICTASIVDGVPRFLRGKGEGWVTAEYGMLPRSTHSRMDREASRGKQGGRTLEIQRLIARSLRQAVDLKAIGENTVTVDCDVIQADGGTRTAAITGGCVALYDALQTLYGSGALISNPFKRFIGAVSVGIYRGEAILDLDYKEDSNAETDMNIVMDEHGKFVEVQGTAEDGAFKRDQFDEMLDVAEDGLKEIVAMQKAAVGLTA